MGRRRRPPMVTAGDLPGLVQGLAVRYLGRGELRVEQTVDGVDLTVDLDGHRFRRGFAVILDAPRASAADAMAGWLIHCRAEAAQLTRREHDRWARRCLDFWPRTIIGPEAR